MLKVLFMTVSDSSVAPPEAMCLTASSPSFCSLLTDSSTQSCLEPYGQHCINNTFYGNPLWHQYNLNTSLAAAFLPHKVCCFWLTENLGLWRWIRIKKWSYHVMWPGFILISKSQFLSVQARYQISSITQTQHLNTGIVKHCTTQFKMMLLVDS